MALQAAEAGDGEEMSEPLGRSLHTSSGRPAAEAEPMLRQVYEGMRARERTIAPIDRRRLAEAVDRLIALYPAPNESEKVK
jgi:hypothetical protein